MKRIVLLLALSLVASSLVGCGGKIKTTIAAPLVFSDGSRWQPATARSKDLTGHDVTMTIAQLAEPACGPDGQPAYDADGNVISYDISWRNESTFINDGLIKQAAGRVVDGALGQALRRPNKTYVRAGNSDAFVNNTNDSSSYADSGSSSTINP